MIQHIYLTCFRILLFIATLSPFYSAHSQTRTIIHIIHPWADDPERAIYPPYIISSESGWYPGTPMNAEGGNWYTYTFRSLNRNTNDRMEYASYIPNEFVEYNDPAKFPATGQLIFKTIFQNAPEYANEVWIIPAGASGTTKFSFTPPPGGKIICFLNPWSLGAPRIKVENMGTGTMRMDRRADRCGWFSYSYYGSSDSISVLFMNSLDSTTSGKKGLSDAGYINLNMLLSKNDSVWIYNSSVPDSGAQISSTYPWVNRECSKEINLAAIMRDIGVHPDFENYGELSAEDCGGLQTGIVESKLGADGKPVKKNHHCTGLNSQFDWFETKTLVGQYTNETCYNLTLTKNEEGLYEFDSDSFYPLDNFLYLDPQRTIKNPNNDIDSGSSNPGNNSHFTMELGASFEYHKGQTFYFRGDDDVWVFIDSQLVVDLGGNHGPEEGSVSLDELGLTPGETYSFKLFFTERNCCGSNFLMQTSLNLHTSSRLFWTKSIPLPGKIQYDLFERISTSSVSCNPSESDVDTAAAKAFFYIEGPQFPVKKQLPNGISYGGISISAGSDVLTLDTSAMTGLETGLYTITYELVSDPTQLGRVVFYVLKPPKPQQVPNPVISAAYFTDNGLGQVDRVEIFYTNDLQILPDSIKLYWPRPAESYLRIAHAPGEIIPDTNNAKHVSVHLLHPFDTSTTVFSGTKQLGESFIYDTAYLQPKAVVQFSIDDSVGPLLMSASMPEKRESGVGDTLYLTFSEKINNASVAGLSLQLVKSDSTRHLLEVASFSQRLDTLIVVTTSSSLSPFPGDLLKIAPGGPLTDRNGNFAHKENRPVPIRIITAPGRVISSWYSDRNADGIVDAATFRFDRPVDIKECSFSISWTGGLQAPNISSSHLKYASTDSTIITADISEAFTSEVPVATSGKMTYQLVISGGVSSTQTGPVADSAAPVVVSAQFRAAAYRKDQDSPAPDTIIIEASEKILSLNSDMPLILKKPSGNDELIPSLKLFEKSENRLSFIFNESVSSELYPSKNDSVFFNPAASIADTIGNKQDNPKNRRELLKYIDVEPHFRILIGPNPFDPAHESCLIIVDPFVKSKNNTFFTVDIVVYDKLGSIVFEKKWPGNQKPASGTYTLEWNGTNRSGRYVGSGTYLCFIKIVDATTNKIINNTQQAFKIGVMRD